MEGPSRRTGMPLQEAAESEQTPAHYAPHGPGPDGKSTITDTMAHLSSSDRNRLDKWGVMHINPLDNTQTSPPLGKEIRALEHIARQVSGDPRSETAPSRIQSAVRAGIASVHDGITSRNGRLDLLHALVEEHSAMTAVKVP